MWLFLAVAICTFLPVCTSPTTCCLSIQEYCNKGFFETRTSSQWYYIIVFFRPKFFRHLDLGGRCFGVCSRGLSSGPWVLSGLAAVQWVLSSNDSQSGFQTSSQVFWPFAKLFCCLDTFLKSQWNKIQPEFHGFKYLHFRVWLWRTILPTPP